MKKMIRIGCLLVLIFMKMNVVHAHPQNFQDTHKWWNLIRCPQCQQAKRNQNNNNNPQLRCEVGLPGIPGSTISREFAYGAAYNNTPSFRGFPLIVKPDTALNFAIFSTNTQVTFNPDQQVIVDVSGDYLIKFTVATAPNVGQASFYYVGLQVNGTLVTPTTFMVETSSGYTLQGQAILPLSTGDQLSLIVPSFAPNGVTLLTSETIINEGKQQPLYTTLAIEKLN